MKKFFKLNEHNVTVKSELLAAFTSFFAAVYIIVVNANILSASGAKMEPLILATVFASLIGCILVALISNAPLAIMPGMGINALFTYTIVKTMGLSFNEALAAVFVAGILFCIVAFTPLADIITKSISHNLKESISVGIGLFITFIGLKNCGFLLPDSSTIIKLANLGDPTIIAFILAMILTIVLFIMNVPGAFLISIIGGTIISVFLGIVDLSTLSFSLPNFNEYNEIFFAMDFGNINSISFWVATFSLTLVLIFENIGLLHGQVNGLLNAPHKTKKALHAVAISSALCGILGTSPSVSTVECAAGIAQGGKTGLTALFTGFLFLLSLFFIPVIKIIPPAAISPVLVIIGCLMMSNVTNIDFKDFTEALPSFLIIVLIPLTFSIVDGIAFGFISYPIAKFAAKKHKEVSLATYCISVIFLIYFVLHVINT
ncbi:NCS2 family permease [Clostridium frigidicarnis]|uniref:Putative MFS transporter, AGZA family, xanthine/uracil permease n=1 Tax=Clostridium frigidicarnis TaxID=84698 RepID=A0A1I0ZIQ5_9CLOT|nr:NCS2 family permease [Clostridium frigidicarnis]SFB24420.1 putative MFS transporter, AGZA family, xanthine/uracil permease [Clostridium frigidicarnis]